jgi:hypothetical protein
VNKLQEPLETNIVSVSAPLGGPKSKPINHSRVNSKGGKAFDDERRYDLPLSKDFTSTVMNKPKVITSSNRVHYAEEEEEKSSTHGE